MRDDNRSLTGLVGGGVHDAHLVWGGLATAFRGGKTARLALWLPRTCLLILSFFVTSTLLLGCGVDRASRRDVVGGRAPSELRKYEVSKFSFIAKSKIEDLHLFPFLWIMQILQKLISCNGANQLSHFASLQCNVLLEWHFFQCFLLAFCWHFFCKNVQGALLIIYVSQWKRADNSPNHQPC